LGKITRKELGDELNNELDSYSTKNELQTLDNKVMSHKAEVASKTKYGHVKIGDGIDVSNGIISVSDVTASNVSIADVANNFDSTTVEGALSELFTNVSNGKLLIGGAITDVDDSVVIPAEPTFQQLADAISQMDVNKLAVGTSTGDSSDFVHIRGLSSTPRFVMMMQTNEQPDGDRALAVYMETGSFYKTLSIGSHGSAPEINKFTLHNDGISIKIEKSSNKQISWVAIL